MALVVRQTSSEVSIAYLQNRWAYLLYSFGLSVVTVNAQKRERGKWRDGCHESTPVSMTGIEM
jgi:hypothetical protein